jgi:ElaA protein
MTGPPIRIASFDELDARTGYLLWKLRVDVFVVEQHCPYPELDGLDLEPGTRHLWLDDDDRPIAYVRILDDDDVVRIGRVCVDESHRGEGLAAQLMQAALDEIGMRRSVLDAQAHMAGWYTRFGYAVSGPAFLEDGMPHVTMHRAGSRRADT